MAENSIFERLIFKIFWGSMPPDPPYRKTLKTRFKSSSLTYQLDCDSVLHTVKLFSKLDENNDK